MFLRNSQPISGDVWIEYSSDGSGTASSMLQTQPINATPDQLVLMGVTVEADPTPAPPAPVVPQIISDRQFFQQLAIQKVITQDEALAAVGPGTLPNALVALIGGLPSDQQFPAKMLLVGAVQFDRQHPMVAVLGQAFGWTDAQLDALWTAAAAL